MIRRTKDRSLLIVLTKESSGKATDLHQAMQTSLGENANVSIKARELDVEVKDLDEITTKEEIVEALQRLLGADSGITLISIKSLRPAYYGTQTAVVGLLAPVAKKFLGRRNIRIGWTYCRIRELIKPLKCIRCWDFGHLA